MNVDVDLMTADLTADALADPESRHRALCALQLILIDDESCRQRIAFLESVPALATKRGIDIPADEPVDSFEEEIGILVEQGVFAAVEAETIQLERLAALARSPQALRKAHEALRALETEIENELTNTVVLSVAGQTLVLNVIEGAELTVQQPRAAGESLLEAHGELQLQPGTGQPVEVYVEYCFESAAGETTTGTAFPNAQEKKTVIKPDASGNVLLRLQFPKPATPGRHSFRTFAHEYSGAGRFHLPTVGETTHELALGAPGPDSVPLDVPATSESIAVSFAEASLDWSGDG